MRVFSSSRSTSCGIKRASRPALPRFLNFAAAALAVALFFVATASGSGTVSQLTHNSYSWAVTISPDGSFVGYNGDEFDGSPFQIPGYTLNLASGAVSSYESMPASFSYDGRFVVYRSGDAISGYHVKRRDTLTGQIMLISASSAAVPGNGDSHDASISWDGRYVAFTSDADNLTPGDTNNLRDIFLKDTQTGTTTRVSTGSGGVQGTGGAQYSWEGTGTPVIAANGRYVAFASVFTNLVPGDTNGRKDVFLKDTLTDITTRVSTDSGGAQGTPFFSSYPSGAAAPELSADGRYVAFEADFANLVPGDANARTDVFVKDTQTGATSIVSVNSDGTQFNEYSYGPSITADGRYVAFNGRSAVYFKDRQTGSLETYATMIEGCTPESGCHFPSGWSPKLAADGSRLVFLGEDWNWFNSVFLAATPSCSANVRPALSLSRSSYYWSSFQSYLDRKLTVDYSVHNAGFEAAYSAAIITARMTEGVTLITPMPYGLGNIHPGSSAPMELVFQAPTGVTVFWTSFTATALDSCGNSHSYP